MGIEIERKFLLANDHWRTAVHRAIPMAQGYLNDLSVVSCGVQNASVRVRIEGEAAALNIKSRQAGHTRQEFDYPIPMADAQALLQLCVGGLVEKTRHLVQVGAHLWEIDEFSGQNAGLIVAEVELGHADEPFQHPIWLGRQVTDSLRYYNLALAERPYSQWSEDERAATDIA